MVHFLKKNTKKKVAPDAAKNAPISKLGSLLLLNMIPSPRIRQKNATNAPMAFRKLPIKFACPFQPKS
jgi:hypothetical protein